MPTLAISKTPLRQAQQLCGRCGGANVYVKDESRHAFGTFKDRRCAAVLEANAGKEELILVHITTGNSGYSLGMLAKQWEDETKDSETGEVQQKRTVVNVVPKGLPKVVRERLECCSIVIEADLGSRVLAPDELIEIARKATGYDGTEENIVVNVETYKLQNGYGNIVHEIAAQMGEKGMKPDYIFCPVGEGELAVELAGAAAEAWGGEAPKIVGVTIPQNVLAPKKDDFLKKPGKSIADKLVNGYSKFKDLLQNTINQGRAEVLTVSEYRIAKEYRYLNGIGIHAEPSAAVAFAGAEAYDLKPDDVVVIVNTGKGLYDEKAVDKLWKRRLAKALKYVAAVAAGMAIAASAFIYKEHLEAKTRFLELQQQELAAQLEYETIERVALEAENYADTNADNQISREEWEEVCNRIPGTTEARCAERGGHASYRLMDFTERELRFYSHYMEIEPYWGMIEMDMRRRMVQRYEEETRRIGGRQGESLGDRHYQIWISRQVKTKSGHVSCDFYHFNQEDPLDWREQEPCPR